MSETPSVQVQGGRLYYERFGAPSPVPVLAAHGLTSHRAAWHRVVALLPDLDIVPVDLCGRGDSRGLPGPSSIAQHAEDLRRLAAGLGAERVVISGHSMGAFVAAAFAAAYPERTVGIVLVDGGARLPASGSVGQDLKRVLDRLSRTFDSREQYREFWRAHPAIGPYWNEAIEHYVDADLHGVAPELRAGSDPERVREDMLDMFASTSRPDPILDIACPAIALRSERGMLDQPEGLYPTGFLPEIATRQPRLEVREVPDVNHYTILLSDHGARHVAGAIRDVVGSLQPTL